MPLTQPFPLNAVFLLLLLLSSFPCTLCNVTAYYKWFCRYPKSINLLLFKFIFEQSQLQHLSALNVLCSGLFLILSSFNTIGFEINRSNTILHTKYLCKINGNCLECRMYALCTFRQSDGHFLIPTNHNYGVDILTRTTGNSLIIILLCAVRVEIVASVHLSVSGRGESALKH